MTLEEKPTRNVQESTNLGSSMVQEVKDAISHAILPSAPQHLHIINIGAGSWDIDLTEEGLFAARKAANLHKDKLADVQRIVSSPLKRTEQTARFWSIASPPGIWRAA